MERKNYILKIEMNEQEASTFAMLTPLIYTSINASEANMISRTLGFENVQSLGEEGFSKNPYLQQAFIALTFLYTVRGNKEVFEDFWERLVFTDKDTERRAKTLFNIPEPDEMLSSTQLELMWMLETDKDEWEDTV